MLVLIPWVIAGWLRLSRHHAEGLASYRHIETAFFGVSTPRTDGDSLAFDRSAYTEQGTGSREHDDHVRWLKVAALHEFKRDFARRPVHSA
jgi:hypothetical protein